MSKEEKSCITEADDSQSVQDEKPVYTAAPEPEDKAEGETSAPAASAGKKKHHRELTPKQMERHTVFVSVLVSLVCSALGVFGGYELFQYNNPKITSLNNSGVTETDTTAFSPASETSIKAMQKSIEAQTVLSDYGNKPADIVNYACYLQSQSKYALTVCHGTVKTVVGDQSIRSATYCTPEEVFNQNISSSSVVHTANRYYDNFTGAVEAYEKKYPSDWSVDGITGKNYSYDSFIQAYGKLQQGLYYCTTQTSSVGIQDKFLTSKKEEFESSEEATKHPVLGVVAYAFTTSTITSGTLEADGDGYKLNMVLEPNTANLYAKAQMKTTGGLTDYPTFSSSSAIFYLNSDLSLKSSVFEDSYTAKIAVISSSASQTLTQRYFRSDSSVFTADDGSSVTVSIPEISQVDFSGLSLFPEE
jgi:hypothetical protein